MNIFKKLAFALLACPLLLTSCSDDESESNIDVVFNAIPTVQGALNVESLAGTFVTFTDTRNQDSKKFELDANGQAKVNLARGTYNITIDKTVKNEQGEDVVISLLMENIYVSEAGQTIEGSVNSLPASALGKDFIFSEIFFNGETNSGRMMHPDQYIVLFNPTEEVLYADGMSVGVTMHLSWQNKQQWYDDFYPTRVPIGGFITIPGTGQEHPVNPGEKIVIAFTATDHSAVEGYDHAVDLSGADFEVYWGPEEKDVDNPEVPNVLISDNYVLPYSYGFFFQPRGYVSPVLFRLENGEQTTVDAFIKSHNTPTNYHIAATDETPASDIVANIWSLKVEEVLDAVQTSDVPQDVKTRCIPETLDRGKFLVNGCHRNELCIRKEIKVGSKTYYKDTNNSSEDMEDVNERKTQGLIQNAFPKGWRNN